MSLEKWTTLRRKETQLLAETLAKQNLPILRRLTPIADFEELLTFAQSHPTPVAFSARTPAWRLESVAARVYEALALAAHETLQENEWHSLARLLLEHVEYLYTYPDARTAREKLEAGTALALGSSVCARLTHAELWRLAGFGRIAAVLGELTPSATDIHLIQPLHVAFSLTQELNLPILDTAVKNYNTRLNRQLTPKARFRFPLSDTDFFHQLNLEFPGLKRVKAAVLKGDIDMAKAEYTFFRRQLLEYFEATTLLDRTNTYSTAKSHLGALLRVGIHPVPIIAATTEIGLAALHFPEFRGSEQLQSLALRRYQWIVDTFFYPDGFHRDRTFHAQFEAITEFSRYLRVKPPRTDELKSFLEKQVEACLYLSQPGRSFPAPENLTFDAIELSQIGDIGFGRDDFQYIASNQQHGSEPSVTSYALPDTGYYVMRESWKPDAQYLLFDAGAVATSSSKKNNVSGSHGASSSPFINKDRISSRLSFLLNVGDKKLIAGTPIVGETVQREAFDTRWITNPDFDFIESWNKNDDVQHKRSIFYLKGQYFILHDVVLGKGKHTLESIFRLLPHSQRKGVPQIVVDGGAAWTQDGEAANLFIGAAHPKNLTVESDAGKITHRAQSQFPTVFNAVLLPMKQNGKERPTISPILVNSDADVLATGFTVALNSVRDTFLISDDGLATISTDTIKFVGEYLFLRDDKFVMLNARYLKVGDKILADLDTPCDSYVEM